MGTLDDSLQAVVDGAYEAALDETLWTPWLQRIVETLGGKAGMLSVMDGADGTVRQVLPFGFGARANEEYGAGMHLRDPQIRHAASLDRSCIYLDSDHVDLSDPVTADYVSWQRATAASQHHMTAVLIGSGRGRAGISIHPALDAGPVAVREQERLAAIFPALGRALELGFRHSEKLSRSYWEGLSQATAEPALLLDERGAVIVMTAKMAALIGAGDGLDVGGGRLRVRSPVQDTRLAALVGRALTSTPQAGAMQLDRPSGRRAYVLTVHPLPRSRRMLAPFEAAALITMIDPAAVPVSHERFWREAFGLTPREVETATLLLAGHSIESAAAMLEISPNTARIHLRRLLAKTETGRQSELVRLLARIV